MKKEIGQLVKHSGIYGLGIVLSKSIGFLMIPVYTRYLLPADYGVLELLDLVIFFGSIFAMMGIHAAFFRFYVASDSPEEEQLVTSTAQLTVAGISLLVLAVMQVLAGALSTVAFGTTAYSALVRIVAITLFFSNLTEIPLAYLRAQQRTLLFVTIGLVRTVFGVALLIVAVAVLRQGVVGVVYANLIANAVGGVALAGYLMSRVGRKVSREKFGQMFRYGAPLIVQSLASFVLVFSDRFFLRSFSTLSQVGIYALAYKLAGIVPLLVSGPFTLTWSWQQFELAKKKNAREIYARIQTYQLLVSASVALAISVLARDILRVLSPSSYWGAAGLVPLLAFSYVLADMRSVVLSGVYVERATHYLAYIGCAVAVVNLGLNCLLIPRFSAMGAAVATVLSYALYLVFVYLAAQRIYFVKYEYVRNAIILGGAAVVYLVSSLLKLNFVSSVLFNLLLLGSFALLSLAILDNEERRMFRQLWALAVQRLTRGSVGAANGASAHHGV
jgi:O-antigen/teichoic acid export membrane protein